jgi:general secretion pathway protein K
MDSAIKYSRIEEPWLDSYVKSGIRVGRRKPVGAVFGLLWGSRASQRTALGGTGKRFDRKRGVALPLVLAIVTVLAVLVADLSRSTTTAFQVAANERDRVKAEYLARSGLNLTRLLIAKEPLIRAVIAPFYQLLLNRQPPQLNVWDFADQFLAPFSNYDATTSITEQTGIDFSQVEGLGKTGGTFSIVAVPENSKINVSKGLFYRNRLGAKRTVAQQLYALIGGYQAKSPYDLLFAERDADGQYTTRLDIVSDVIDWWDEDEARTIFDPGASIVTEAGSEDDIYTTFRDAYRVKNAPYDSLEELRLVRGIGDDFWATFVEPESTNPKTRLLTVYGSGAVNVNQAEPLALLTRLCSFPATQVQPICSDPLEGAKFVQILGTTRSLLPVALFSSPDDFLKFVQGGKGDPMNLYTLLASLTQVAAQGNQNPLLFTPLVIPENDSGEVIRSFLASADIYTVRSTGAVGKVQVSISAVVNFDKNWKPPAPNAGLMPGLGAFYHYRVD